MVLSDGSVVKSASSTNRRRTRVQIAGAGDTVLLHVRGTSRHTHAAAHALAHTHKQTNL